MMLVEANDIVLFQGDSITDAGRNMQDMHDLGRGYAWMISGLFGAAFPELQVQFYNRGISGHRVKDLQARWDEDCIALQPNVLSIYIGINDTWRRYDQQDPTSAEQYEAGYRDLLERTCAQTSAKLVLVEPFVLPYPADREAWREDLEPKIEVASRLAQEYGAVYVPLDGLFTEASSKASCAFWAPDGVHPSAAGHALIANAWMSAVGAR